MPSILELIFVPIVLLVAVFVAIACVSALIYLATYAGEAAYEALTAYLRRRRVARITRDALENVDLPG